MIGAISNNTMDAYMLAMRKSLTKNHSKVLDKAVDEVRRTESTALDDLILKNNMLGNITFLKETDKQLFTRSIV